MRFKYQATTKDGRTVEAEAEARDKFELARQLKNEGSFIIFAEEISESKFSIFSRVQNIFETVSLREKIVFMRNLSAMIDAGLPLVRALGVLIKQTKSKKFNNILKSVSDKVSQGSPLSESLSIYPRVFHPLSVSMTKAGEESGNLPESLEIIGEHLEKSYLLRRRIRGALMYPSIVLIAMFIIGILMLVYIVPTLTGVFEELDVELPVTTQFIILVSDFLQENTLTTLLIVVVGVVAVYLASRMKQSKRVIDASLFYIPIIGPLVQQTNAARTARTLSSLLSSGVQMVEALSITENVVQNSYYKDILKEAASKIQKGIPLSRVFNEHDKYYPVLMGEMVSVGEETGKLPEMLMRIALFYEGEIEQKTKNMSTIIEPILMIIVGIGVGFFAVSMITPLYSVLQGI